MFLEAAGFVQCCVLTVVHADIGQWLLYISPYSARVERLFSIFGTITTALALVSNFPFRI